MLCLNQYRSNDDGITPMHQAASEGHIQCLKALIDRNAKIYVKDYRGHTPLDLAKLWGHRQCARLVPICSVEHIPSTLKAVPERQAFN